MKRHLLWFWVLLICLLGFVAQAQEATVYMKNGKELPPGKVLIIENGVLIYKSDYGDLSMPLDQVDQIVFAAGTKDREGIVLSTGDWIGGTVTSYRDGIWQIKTEFGQAVVTKPDIVTSVNLSKPKVLALKGLTKKGVTYRYVVDWLYSNQLMWGQDQDEWALRIEKVTLVNNQIIFSCSIKSSKRILGIRPRFRLHDEFGNEYSPLKSSFVDGDYGFLDWKSGQVIFPNLKEGSRVIVLYFGQPDYSYAGGYARETGISNPTSTPNLEIADLLVY